MATFTASISMKSSTQVQACRSLTTQSLLGRSSSIVVTFSGQNLVVVRAEFHVQLRPSIEVVGGGHSTTLALGLANRDELVERRGSLNRWGIGASGLVDVVGGAVGGDSSNGGAELVGLRVIFDHIVFNEGVRSPAVDLGWHVSMTSLFKLEVN